MIHSVCGPVDVYRSDPLPDEITLNALVLVRNPGPDGLHFKASDVISDGAPISVTFKRDSHRLASVDAVSIPLKTGSWRTAVLLLVDDNGDPFAQGAVRTPDGLPVSGSLDAPKNRLKIEHHPRR